jgi:predicted RNA-binding Zn ribbon-like protein
VWRVTEAIPRELDLLRAFVNTRDLESGSDALASPSDLECFLVARGLVAGDVATTSDDLATALELRESLRALLRANLARGRDERAVARLNQIAARLPLRVRLTPLGQPALVPHDGGAAGALGRILAALAIAMAEGTWARLKACSADDCQWAFYDRSRNRSGRWCSMSVCGNRTKIRAYRRRRAEFKSR